MQLRDVEPGTVVTVPLWGGREKYIVQPVKGPIHDIPIKDESKTEYVAPCQIQVEVVRSRKAGSNYATA